MATAMTGRRGERRPRPSLRAGLRLFLLVAVITGLLSGVGAVLVVRNERQQRRSTIESTVGFAEAAARSADQVIKDDLALLNLIATSPELASVDPSAVQAVLDAIDVKNAGFTGGVSWVGADGMLEAATGRKAHAPPENMSDKPYVQAVLDRGVSTFVSEGFSQTGVPGVSVMLAVPAIDGSKRTVGVVMGSLSLDRVARHLTGFNFGGTDLLVLDQADQLLISGTSGSKLSDTTTNATTQALRRAAPAARVGVTDPLGRRNRLVAGAISPTGNWLVLVSRSSTSAFGPDRHNMQQELLGLAMAGVIALAIAWMGARRLEELQAVAAGAAAAEQSDRERAVGLRLAMAEIATAETRDDVANTAALKGRTALGARASAVALRLDDARDAMRLVAHQGYTDNVSQDWGRFPMEPSTPTGQALETGTAQFFGCPELTAAFPGVADRLVMGPKASLAAVPLRVEGRPFGVLTLIFDDDSALAPGRQLEIISFATEVAIALAWVGARQVEHEFALTLQRGLLPASLPSGPDVSVEADYLPANGVFEVGGDWYDALERPDGALTLVVGDVVGHGVSAIAAMGQLSSVSRAVADEASPARLLDYLDRLARRVPSAVGTTAVCVLVDPDRRSAQYSIAGHPRPLLIEGGQVRELDEAVSVPLAYDDDVVRQEATVELHPPSTLVLFTDGLIERRDITYTERVDLLRQIAGTTPAAGLRQAIIDAMVTNDQSPDDTVVMVVHLPVRS